MRGLSAFVATNRGSAAPGRCTAPPRTSSLHDPNTTGVPDAPAPRALRARRPRAGVRLHRGGGRAVVGARAAHRRRALPLVGRTRDRSQGQLVGLLRREPGQQPHHRIQPRCPGVDRRVRLFGAWNHARAGDGISGLGVGRRWRGAHRGRGRLPARTIRRRCGRGSKHLLGKTASRFGCRPPARSARPALSSSPRRL